MIFTTFMTFFTRVVMNDINRSNDESDKELDFDNSNDELSGSDDNNDRLSESDNKTSITLHMRLLSPTDMMREEYNTLNNLIRVMQDHSDSQRYTVCKL